jgi:hypothetical protein
VNLFCTIRLLSRARRLLGLVLLIGGCGAGVAGAAAITIATGTLVVSSKTLTHATCTLTGTAQTADAEVREANAGSNFSTQASMVTRPDAPNRRRGYLVFDLTKCSPAIPANAEVDSATLILFATGVPATRTITLYRVTSSWTEAGITWSAQPTVAASATTSLSLSSTGAKSFDVTNDVNDFTQSAPTPLPPYAATVPDFGWMIDDEGAGTTQITFGSSENGTAARRPTLVIAYAS